MIVRVHIVRVHSERGAPTVELMALLPFMILGAILVWQLLMSAAVVNAAENAARNGSRLASQGEDGEEGALDALPGWLAEHAVAERGPNPDCDDDTTASGTRVVVCVDVPVLVPGVAIEGLTLRRDAEFPPSS